MNEDNLVSRAEEAFSLPLSPTPTLSPQHTHTHSLCVSLIKFPGLKFHNQRDFLLNRGLDPFEKPL